MCRVVQECGAQHAARSRQMWWRVCRKVGKMCYRLCGALEKVVQLPSSLLSTPWPLCRRELCQGQWRHHPYATLPAQSEIQAQVLFAFRCLCCACRMVHKYGEGQWSLISTFFTGRIGKQCRERWHHQLNPNINRNAWSMEEERIIVDAHKVGQPRCHSFDAVQA